MANTDVARFFEAAYNDRDLQGALHAALCKLAPEVIVEMAATKGYKFTSEDLQEAASKPADHELTDQEMAAVAGGGIVPRQVGVSAYLASNFWGVMLTDYGMKLR
jgi:predicted ribosomally synthesized peptide with nif11-like leader